MKTCRRCGIAKPPIAFSKHSGFADGRRSACKLCYNAEVKSDPFRFFRKIYATQKANSTKRGHPPPAYTLDELIAWADAQPQLPAMWDAYQKARHPRRLAPSVDRVDPNKPYTLSNLELVTWEENDRRGSRDTKTETKTTQHKPVMAINPDGSIYKTYCSLHEAARDVGGSATNIQRVADKVPVRKPNGNTTIMRSTKGFNWRWA